MKLTLYEAIHTLSIDKDISDDVYDFLVYFTCEKEEGGSSWYDDLMVYFAKNIEVVSVNDVAICCRISKFIEDHLMAFTTLMNDQNKASYKPKNYEEIDDELFYDLYMNTFASLVSGNYAESDYKQLYELLTSLPY